jgi:hypothetical protein
MLSPRRADILSPKGKPRSKDCPVIVISTGNPHECKHLDTSSVTVITGDGGPPLAARTVIVRGDRIDAVLPANEGILPPGAEIIDAGGCYLVPGFVDTHAHVAMGPITVELHDGQPAMTMEPLPSVAEATARNLLGHGITLARDPGGPAHLTTATRDRIARGALPGPALQVAGDVIDTSRFDNLVATVSSVEDVRTEVARQAGLGVDWIKLYVGLTPDLIAAGIDEAHRHGLRVTGHLQRTTWTQAARAGMDSIVHATPGSAELLPYDARAGYLASMTTTLFMMQWFGLVDRDATVITEMLATLRDHDVSVDPTLVVFHSMAHGDRPRYTENPALELVPTELVSNGRTFFNFNFGWTPEDFATARGLPSTTSGRPARSSG